MIEKENKTKTGFRALPCKDIPHFFGLFFVGKPQTVNTRSYFTTEKGKLIDVKYKKLQQRPTAVAYRCTQLFNLYYIFYIYTCFIYICFPYLSYILYLYIPCYVWYVCHFIYCYSLVEIL